MDGAWAALLGAAIGGGTAVVVAVVGPFVTARLTARSRRRDEIRTEIARVLDAMLVFLNARARGQPDAAERHVEMVVATTRLSVLLSSRDRDVDVALGFAVSSIVSRPIPAGLAAIDALRSTLHDWYRGDVRGKRVGDRYGRNLDAALQAQTRK